jgi:hypothetical protein
MAELSPIRQKVLALVEDWIPDNPTGLSSDHEHFRMITGFSTFSLEQWWAEHPEGTKGSMLTTCNALLGWMARQLGARQGSQLARGLLQLDLADKDVPGCFRRPGAGEMFRPGDFYATPFLHKGWKQPFGHVGIVYDVHDTIVFDTVDSGQGGRSAGKDFIRFKKGRIWDTNKITGWVDLDRYFAA